jgi:hypothetical protein
LPTPHPCGTDAPRRSAAGEHAQRALAIALEAKETILLAGTHQIGDRSVLALVEIRLRRCAGTA